jgi:hypothetical protein
MASLWYIRSGTIRNGDCKILADVSKDNVAFIVLKAGWAPGQVWAFTIQKSCLSLNRTT